ncbi:hypothetical protein OC834_007920, partial [Tilletia horrida]
PSVCEGNAAFLAPASHVSISDYGLPHQNAYATSYPPYIFMGVDFTQPFDVDEFPLPMTLRRTEMVRMFLDRCKTDTERAGGIYPEHLKKLIKLLKRSCRSLRRDRDKLAAQLLEPDWLALCDSIPHHEPTTDRPVVLFLFGTLVGSYTDDQYDVPDTINVLDSYNWTPSDRIMHARDAGIFIWGDMVTFDAFDKDALRLFLERIQAPEPTVGLPAPQSAPSATASTAPSATLQQSTAAATPAASPAPATAAATLQAGTSVAGNSSDSAGGHISVGFPSPGNSSSDSAGGHISVGNPSSGNSSNSAGGHIGVGYPSPGNSSSDSAGGHISVGYPSPGNSSNSAGGHISVGFPSSGNSSSNSAGGHISVGFPSPGNSSSDSAGGHISVGNPSTGNSSNSAGGHNGVGYPSPRNSSSTSAGGHISVGYPSPGTSSNSAGGHISVGYPSPGNSSDSAGGHIS